MAAGLRTIILTGLAIGGIGGVVLADLKLNDAVVQNRSVPDLSWRLRKPASPDHAAGTVYSGDPTERWVSFKPVLTLHNLRRQDRARALD